MRKAKLKQATKNGYRSSVIGFQLKRALATIFPNLTDAGNGKGCYKKPLNRQLTTDNRQLFLLGLLLVFFETAANPAHAVIPQLLGPLTALLSIVPQILAFVGVALITALVFARDTTKNAFL